MATTISHVLHRASTPPSGTVLAYHDRNAVGRVVVDGLISLLSEDPAQFYALAEAATKAAVELEEQHAADGGVLTTVKPSVECSSGHTHISWYEATRCTRGLAEAPSSHRVG